MAPLPQKPENKNKATRTIAAIVDALERTQFASRNARLGAADWGKECLRATWYAFRYSKSPKRFSGQMVRLFETGHIQEARVVADLRRAGFEVLDLDPSTATERHPKGKQWEYTFFNGHAVVRLDGKIKGLPEAPATWHVLEIKTHNSKSFAKLDLHGVAKAKPEHFAQCQVGMHGANLDRALYVAINKDTDETYAERVYLDPPYIAGLMAKGERVIFSDSPPPQLHSDPDAKGAFACRFCDYLDICHQGAFAERNCRTCLRSTAAKDGAGKWDCEKFGPEIPADFQRTPSKCAAHLFNPHLVPGEDLSADAEAETVTYRLFTTGQVWTDGPTEQ